MPGELRVHEGALCEDVQHVQAQALPGPCNACRVHRQRARLQQLGAPCVDRRTHSLPHIAHTQQSQCSSLMGLTTGTHTAGCGAPSYLCCTSSPPPQYLNQAREQECEKNPGFMLTTCRAACRQCQSLSCNDAHLQVARAVLALPQLTCMASSTPSGPAAKRLKAPCEFEGPDPRTKPPISWIPTSRCTQSASSGQRRESASRTHSAPVEPRPPVAQ